MKVARLTTFVCCIVYRINRREIQAPHTNRSSSVLYTVKKNATFQTILVAKMKKHLYLPHLRDVVGWKRSPTTHLKCSDPPGNLLSDCCANYLYSGLVACSGVLIPKRTHYKKFSCSFCKPMPLFSIHWSNSSAQIHCSTLQHEREREHTTTSLQPHFKNKNK